MDLPVDVSEIRAWLNDFLAARGVAADGRPLFAYKTTSDEYRQLAKLLAAAARSSEDTTAYAQAWFLYAAEWWKRDYSGGAWAWGPVFHAFGRSPPNQAQIQSMVTKARKTWGLTGALLGGKKYIGQVAINGGLPLRLLEAAQGSLARILKTALQHAVTYKLEQPQVYAEIEGQAELLPRSYRQAMVFDLLASVVEAVKNLRDQHALAGEKDPIATLERVNPGWMDQFPLAFDNSSAALLINGLVREAASAEQKSTRQPFQVIRGLRFSSDGSGRLELSFEMPATASKDAVGRALQTDPSMLPAVFQLLLRIDSRDYLVGEAHLRPDNVRLLPKRSDIPEGLVQSAVQLIASRYGSTITAVNIPGGDSLDEDEPWIFEDAAPYSRLIRAGSASIKAASAIALVPERAIVFCDDGEAVDLPATGIPGRRAIRIPSGMTRFVINKEPYRVRCDASQASDEGIYWQGKTLQYPSVPDLVFIGKPTLRYALPGGDIATAQAAELFQQVSGKARMSLLSPTTSYGLCRVSWEKGQEIQSQRKAVLLPPNASVGFESGRSPLEGVVWLRNWPCQTVASLSQDIRVTPAREGPDWRIEVVAKGVGFIQALPLKVLWEGGEQRLTLPFPGEGAIILDSDGAVIPRKSWLSLGSLVGCRVILLPNQRRSSWRIRLSLNGESTVTRQTTRTIVYGQASEIRLFELVDSVRQMISCVTDLDSSVSIEVMDGPATHAEVLVGRYARQVRWSPPGNRICISNGQRELGPDEADTTELLAIPIQTPERDPLPLAKIQSEGVFTGTWDGDLSREQQGTWIVYPTGIQAVDCRPLAISGGEASAPVIGGAERLRAALGDTERDSRIAKISVALGDMAELPGHQEWDLVAAIQQALGQLPLSGLDVWVALSRQPAAMVMAFLHLEGFAETISARLPNELPFEWLLTSPREWIGAFRALKNFYSSNHDSRGFRLLQADIASKKEQILNLQPALKFSLQLAYHFGFEIEDKDVLIYQKNADIVIYSWLGEQFDGEDSQIQSLLRRSMTDQESWPVELKSRTDTFMNSPAGKEIFSRVKIPHEDFKMTTIVLPFLVAWDVVNGSSGSWQKDAPTLLSLRRYRDFDPAWFDSAYLVGLAYAYKGFLPQ